MSEDSFYQALQTRPPVWLRLQGGGGANVLRELSERGGDPEVHSHLKKAVKLSGKRLNLPELNSFRQGRFEVQDLASQCLGVLCSPQQGESWWDVCAGAGGKSLLLADQLKGRGQVTSTDIRQWILDELKKSATRAGFKNIRPQKLYSIYKSQQKFDGILIDAPCSCTGTWRRNPDIRWSAPMDTCEKAAETQKDIISKAVVKLKPGAVLVYATCSLSIQENEQVVAFILEKYPQLKLEAFANPLSGELTDGTLKILPYAHNTDGMYAARFRAKT